MALLPKEQLAELAYGRSWEPGDDLQALYHRGTRKVYLHEGWNEADPHCVAILVHELVHHVQAFNRVETQCAAASERDAYALSVKWLRREGVPDPYAVLNIDRFTIAALSACAASE